VNNFFQLIYLCLTNGTCGVSKVVLQRHFYRQLYQSKNAEFHADFKSVKKVFKNVPKKVISKNVTEICTFYTCTHVRQTCFAYDFCIAFFKNFFNELFRHQGQAGNAELEFLNNPWGPGAEKE
jgi:hypothetical protein